MRSNAVLLLDMLLASQKIMRYVGELMQEQFENSDLHQSAVIRELQIIGEAARLVDEQTKQEHSEIAWNAIAGLRNRVVHEYFRVDTDILWNVIQDDIPHLIDQLASLIPDNKHTSDQK